MQKFLKYAKPMNLYAMVEPACKKFLCLDTGSSGIGICVVDPADPRPFPVPVLSSCQGNFLLSPLETALQEMGEVVDSSVPAGSFNKRGMFVLDRLIPLQVLKPKVMSINGIRNVLNSLTELHDVGGFIFSFSADSRNWNKEKKYKFTAELVSRLEVDGRLSQRNFTFADEVDSTKYAEWDVSRLYPALSYWKHFIEKFPNIGKIEVYQDKTRLAKDLRDFRKGLVDCYSARNCLDKFGGKCAAKKLYSNQQNDAKQARMVRFARSCGYVDPTDSQQ